MTMVIGVTVGSGVVESCSGAGLANVNGVAVSIIGIGVFVFISMLGIIVGVASGVCGAEVRTLLNAKVNATPDANRLNTLTKNDVSDLVRYPLRIW
ncbi:MAG: hypothetical protein KF758_01865 [Anaerolineales bacterium]|nr:hypothetical protein [Anaerolineales bacterium]